MAGSGKPPDPAALHEAALAHLARYAATRAGLERVLLRRIARWARRAAGEQPGDEREAIAAAAAEARGAVKEVVARLVAAGAVNDAAFAAARAKRLARAGSSRQRIAAHLGRHGIRGAALAAALPAGPDAELLAALALARRRRIGPFRTSPPADPEAARRELAALARAGFPHGVARAALAIPRAEAEERLAAARQAIE